jgi:hypothetical protein
MKFYFAWAPEASAFCPATHAKEDLKIFSMKIIEDEGAYAHACLVVPNPKKRDVFQAYAHISVDCPEKKVQLLFSGKVLDCPTRIDGETIQIELIGTCPKRETLLKALALQQRQSPDYHPLFTSESRRNAPDWGDLLLGSAKLPYVSRTGDKVTLCPIDQANRMVDVKGAFFRDSLQLGVSQAPYHKIEVELSAHWLQRFNAITCLDTVMQDSLAAGTVTTFLPTAFEQAWWKADQKLGLTGYRVLESSLEERSYLHDSIKIGVENQLPIRLQCKAYQPKLTVAWQYVQPRRETVIFSLKNKCQSLSLKPSRTKVLKLNLGNVAERYLIPTWGPDIYYSRNEKVEVEGQIYEAKRSHRSSASFNDDKDSEWHALGPKQSFPLQSHQGTFFTTPIGQKCVEHAIEIARCYLLASTRSVELKFSCALSQALEWSTDCLVRLEDDRLKGGQAQGKIKRLIYEVCGQKGILRAHVVLACSIGVEEQGSIAGQSDLPRSGAEGEASVNTTFTGVPYKSFADQLPARGITFPQQLCAQDIVREVAVVNGAERQKELLASVGNVPSQQALEATLKKNQTRLNLRLEDLRASGILEHTIHVDLPYAWSAPKQFLITH